MGAAALNPFRQLALRHQTVSEAQLRCLPARLPRTLFVSASLYRLLKDDRFLPDILDMVLKRILHRWRTEGYLVQASRVWFWQGESQRLLTEIAQTQAAKEK